ncbi:type II toxin-antitoxin system VapC family toxin [Neoaquamicrobium sediminum]|uniref:type II toxin-antitoxin system VapC family toxin n=1 Tax=Neoaquamicrobium sediminum TaxID=1849104 RepID=UPI003BA86BB0
MRVIDSSIWVEWLDDGALAAHLEPELSELDTLIVPTMVQLEVTKWLLREIGVDAANSFLALTRQCRVAPLDTATAAAAAVLCHQHKLATADAIIYATALHADADLLTCDAHFEGLEKVVYLPKGG